MSNRASLGGMSTGAAATRDNYASRDSNIIQFPSGSILAEPSGPSLERSQFTKALLDILCLGSFALLICSVASAIGIFGYVFKLQFFS
jgi:hypothetical protein